MNRSVAVMEQPAQKSAPLTIKDFGKGVMRLRTGSRRFLLLSVGAWAAVYDSTAHLARATWRLIETAEQRGERMEDSFLQRFRLVEDKAVDQLRHLQEGIKIDDARATLDGALTYSHDELAERIQTMLDSLGIPSREQLERLNREIDQLNEKIDLELQRRPVHA